METIKPATPLPFGQRLILQGGYEYEINARHHEWLAVLEKRANAYPKLVEALRGVLCVAYSFGLQATGTGEYQIADRLLRELGEI